MNAIDTLPEPLMPFGLRLADLYGNAAVDWAYDDEAKRELTIFVRSGGVNGRNKRPAIYVCRFSCRGGWHPTVFSEAMPLMGAVRESFGEFHREMLVSRSRLFDRPREAETPA